TQLKRILRKAGLEPWPKLFQNLRSSRETELAERFPLHVVTAWLGNSATVAQKHYLQVTEAHIAEAAKRQR
ncbi:MAG: integrase, partial [Planctomycetota bacterium]